MALADSSMSEGFVGRPERASPLVFDHCEGVLIFLERGVEVSLRLEGSAEIDMHLKRWRSVAFS